MRTGVAVRSEAEASLVVASLLPTVSSYCTFRSQSSSDVYGLLNHACNSCRNRRAFSLPRKSRRSSSAWPALPLISTVRRIAMIYSNRNSALFALRFSSLGCPGPFTLLIPCGGGDERSSEFKKVKTRSSRRIHLRARDTSSSSRLKSSGVSSRYLDRRFEPTRREYSWLR